ncbi:hypothetical protein BV011_01824 [Haemophilus influenzae]|nr:hypothetical protein BV011_01824 [Haemophilus influenzae]
MPKEHIKTLIRSFFSKGLLRFNVKNLGRLIFQVDDEASGSR